MKRMIPAGLLLALAVPAWADTVFVDGQPCMRMGDSIHCPGTFSDPAQREAARAQREAARAQRAETQRLQQKSRALEDCLRKADWPGMPGRSECYQLYGGQ